MGLALALPNLRIVGLDGGRRVFKERLVGYPDRAEACDLTFLTFDNRIHQASRLRPTATSVGPGQSTNKGASHCMDSRTKVASGTVYYVTKWSADLRL